MRGIGVTQAVTDVLPAWSVPVAAGLTVIGDPVLVLVAAVLLYWFGERYGFVSRSNGLRVFVVTIAVLAVVTTTKQYFGLPRPPSPSIAYTAAGYGFPSGHTTAATGFYGAVALLGEWWSRQRRMAVAGGLIGLVGMTRLVLGVHYLVDVLAGMLTGMVVIGVVLAVTSRRVWPGFVVALLAGVVAVVVTGLDPAVVMSADGAVAFGGTVGATIAWVGVTRTGATWGTPSWPVAAGGALVAGIPLGVATWFGMAPLVLIGAAGIAGGVVVAVPTIRTSRGTGRVPTR